MNKAGVDFTNPQAVRQWVEGNPKMMRNLSNQALQAGFASIAGDKAGGFAAGFVKNPMGQTLVDNTVSKAVEEILGPKDRDIH